MDTLRNPTPRRSPYAELALFAHSPDDQREVDRWSAFYQGTILRRGSTDRETLESIQRVTPGR